VAIHDIGIVLVVYVVKIMRNLTIIIIIIFKFK